MPLYYVTENVVNTYEVDALNQQDAIENVKDSAHFGMLPIDIDTVEWSAELAVPLNELGYPEDSLEARCMRLEDKLDAILARLSGAGK